MTHVMGPDYNFLGNWIVGGPTTIDSCLLVVTYEGMSRAYVIKQEDYFHFCEWICGELIDEYDVECDHPDDFMREQDIDITRTNLEDL